MILSNKYAITALMHRKSAKTKKTDPSVIPDARIILIITIYLL
jgi:hypothetical protein